MKKSLQRSMEIVRDNPLLILVFVIYLILLITVLPLFVYSPNKTVLYLVIFVSLLLTSSFAAGWFGIIKSAVLNYKEKKEIEEKINDFKSMKKSFFCSVSSYILPFIAAFAILVLYSLFMTFLADKYIGKIDDIAASISNLANNQDALIEYFKTMPEAKMMILAKRSFYGYIGFLIFAFCTMYWTSALYLNTENSKNPLTALKNSILAIIKKPFITIVIFLLVFTGISLITLLESMFLNIALVSFLLMILKIYYITFSIVLIFDLYEREITNNCHNRTDCLRQDEPCAEAGEKD